jgi:prepilin-type N-terminal cleavage/methylation domain-containing protein
MNNCCGNDQGFTLLEIIAVLVILSILAAIAVPKYVQ